MGLLLVLSRRMGRGRGREADHKPVGLEGLGNKPLALGTEPAGLGTAGDLPTAVRGSGLWAGRVQGVRPAQRAVYSKPPGDGLAAVVRPVGAGTTQTQIQVLAGHCATV